MANSSSTTPETTTDLPDKQKLHSIKIGEMLYRRIDDHIRTQKRFGEKRQTKNAWLEEAVKEKLESERDFSAGNIPREKHLSVSLSKSLTDELEKRVELLKNLLEGYSKKRFILEAALEKLEREEAGLKKLMDRQHNA